MKKTNNYTAMDTHAAIILASTCMDKLKETHNDVVDSIAYTLEKDTGKAVVTVECDGHADIKVPVEENDTAEKLYERIVEKLEEPEAVEDIKVSELIGKLLPGIPEEVAAGLLAKIFLTFGNYLAERYMPDEYMED